MPKKKTVDRVLVDGLTAEQDELENLLCYRNGNRAAVLRADRHISCYHRGKQRVAGYRCRERRYLGYVHHVFTECYGSGQG